MGDMTVRGAAEVEQVDVELVVAAVGRARRDGVTHRRGKAEALVVHEGVVRDLRNRLHRIGGRTSSSGRRRVLARLRVPDAGSATRQREGLHADGPIAVRRSRVGRAELHAGASPGAFARQNRGD